MTTEPLPVDLSTFLDNRRPVAAPASLGVADMLRIHAAHEAGHAVVGMTFGMSLNRLCVQWIHVGAETGLTGAASWNVSNICVVPYAMMCAAGEVAALRHIRENGLLDEESAQDFVAPHDRDQAIEVARQGSFPITVEGPAPEGGKTWAEILEMTAEYIDDLWPHIEHVTEDLLAAPGMTMTGAQVSETTGIPNPVAAQIVRAKGQGES